MNEKYLNGLNEIKAKFIKGFVILSYKIPYFSDDIKNYMKTLKDFGYFEKKRELEEINFESLDIYLPKGRKSKKFYIIFVRVPEMLKEKYRDIRTYIGIEKKEANKLGIHRRLEDLLDQSLLENSPNKEKLKELFGNIYIIIPTENKKEERIFWEKIYSLSSYLHVNEEIVNKIKEDVLSIFKYKKRKIKKKYNKIEAPIYV